MPTTGPVDGIARKVSLSFVFVSVIGWLVFTVFFGLTINRYSNRIDILFLPHWCFMVTGVFLYTNLIISLVINGRWYTDTTIHLFNALYLAAGGATLYTDWTTYYSLYNQDVRFMFELGGCVLSGLCLTFSIMMWPCFTNVRVRNALIADADSKVATPVRESTSQPPVAMVNLSSVDIQGTNAKIVDPEEEDEYASLTDMQDSTTDYKQHLQSPTSPEGVKGYDSVASMRMGAHFQAQDEGNYVINQLDAQEEGHYVINKLDAPDPEEGDYVINKLDAPEEGDYVINKLDTQEGEYSEVSLVVHEQSDQQQEL